MSGPHEHPIPAPDLRPTSLKAIPDLPPPVVRPAAKSRGAKFSTATRLGKILAYRNSSVRELERATGISRGILTEYLGDRLAITSDHLFKLATALEVPPRYLTKENPDQP